MQSHIRKVYACLAVTCHLHFWQNDRDLLRATAMRNEPWVWPEVGDAGTSGAGAVPLRSAQLMEQQKKRKEKVFVLRL